LKANKETFQLLLGRDENPQRIGRFLSQLKSENVFLQLPKLCMGTEKHDFFDSVKRSC